MKWAVTQHFLFLKVKDNETIFIGTILVKKPKQTSDNTPTKKF